MPKITLPDGSVRQFDTAVSGAEVAASIGAGLAKAAVAVRVNGALWDLTRLIEDDSALEILTRDSDDGLELIRHDAAHVLAEAVKELWPDTQVTIGPAIENGFYYDFAREEPFTDADLETIEARMKDIVDRDEPIEREVWERDKAADFSAASAKNTKQRLLRAFPRRKT
jgi:threonyl-tRNA synthetase